MRTNTYLSISNKWFWEKMHYALPQKSDRASRTNAGLEHSTETVFKNEAYGSTETVDGVNTASQTLQVYNSSARCFIPVSATSDKERRYKLMVVQFRVYGRGMKS